MRHRQLGNSGLMVSEVGVGCNNFGSRLDKAGTASVVSAALDAGITLFDTADMYGEKGLSESYLGAALAKHRSEVIIATKFGMDMAGKVMPDWAGRGSRDYILRAVEGSLSRLGTDYIDLYQFHEVDPITPIEETLETLSSLVESGKVRYIGCSNFESWRIADAHWVAETKLLKHFISFQTKYHFLDRSADKELVPVAAKYGLGILPYYPLANGLLTGKYSSTSGIPAGSRLEWRSGWATEESLARVDQIRDFAEARDLRVIDVAFSWLLANPTVGSVIAGAMTAEQVSSNANSTSWIPSAEDLAELDKIVAPGETVV